MEQPTNRWRFTLREMLFAITAIAAVLALIVSNLPPRLTQFHTSFDVEQALAKESRRRNLLSICIQAESDSGEEKESEYLIQTPDETHRLEAMESLRALTEASLNENGCSVYSADRAVQPLEYTNHANTFSFRFRYRHGRTHGFFYAYSFPEADGVWRLVVFRKEW